MLNVIQSVMHAVPQDSCHYTMTPGLKSIVAVKEIAQVSDFEKVFPKGESDGIKTSLSQNALLTSRDIFRFNI